jgi:uncharacterized membrane protein YcaP (DUF421 family)
MTDTFLIVFRSVTVYLFIIFALRLFGKKELAQLSIIDLVLILLISNSVQNAMVGNNTSLVGGLTAAASLFVISWILKILIFRSKNFSGIVQGNPLMLVYRGKIIQKHLDQAKLSNDELEAAAREHGVRDVKDVDIAILEVDGNISILSKNFTRRSTKKRRIHKSLGFTS